MSSLADPATTSGRPMPILTTTRGFAPRLSLSLRLAFTFSLSLSPCACGGTDFVKNEYEAEAIDHSEDWMDEAAPRPQSSERAITEAGGSRRGDLFRNTYYDFPAEGGGTKNAKVFDASCQPIASVTKDFHDKVCVQGSGRLSTGETVSFAKRDCACAAECPRSGQKICFEKLDPKAFPSGRGSLGTPVTPLRTVAVDPAVVPLGSVLFIPEFEGLTRPDNKKHDGCFLAEDRGSKVVGRHIDIFTGDPAVTQTWNQLMPSNEGVHVEIGATRCAHLKPAASAAP